MNTFLILHLLIQKGYFTEAEFLEKMKEMLADYQKAGRHYCKPR
jgi:hypothetical protein